MLNPLLNLKNTLFLNCINSFINKLLGISARFAKAKVSVGYIKTSDNPSDTVTRLLQDPVAVINSNLYRYGPSKYDTIASLKEDTVGFVSDGHFQYIGIPTRFLPPEPQENCLHCNDNCMLVTTRSQKQRGKMSETANDDKAVVQNIERKVSKLEIISKWLSEWRYANLLSCHEPLLSTYIVGKDEYIRITSKLFSFQQIIRFMTFLAALDLAKRKIEEQVDIRSEGFGLWLRTSQAHYTKNLAKLTDISVSGVKCMSLRLQLHQTHLFGSNFIPVIGCDDPIIRKIIRFYHLVSCPEFQTPHRNGKSTVHAISTGQFGVTWAT